MRWKTEEEFCRYIRERWGDAYADDLEERVEVAVKGMPEEGLGDQPC